MKKVYVKPMIMFEDFTLTTNMAAGCEIKIEGQSNGNCGYYSAFLDTPIFVTGVSGCTKKIEDGSVENVNGKICYDVPISTNNLFNS